MRAPGQVSGSTTSCDQFMKRAKDSHGTLLGFFEQAKFVADRELQVKWSLREAAPYFEKLKVGIRSVVLSTFVNALDLQSGSCISSAMQGLPSFSAGNPFSRQALRGRSIFPQKAGPRHRAGTRRAAPPSACSCASATELNGPSASGSELDVPASQNALRAWKRRPLLRTILRKCRPLRKLSSR